MKNLVQYFTFIALFMAGVMMGTMAATPGKSESYSILKAHGAYDAVNGSYLVYLPVHTKLTTEEFEALAVVSTLYDRVEIVYPDFELN